MTTTKMLCICQTCYWAFATETDHILTTTSDNCTSQQQQMTRTARNSMGQLQNLSYEERLKECGLTTLETRQLRGDQIEVFKVLNGYENIDRHFFFTQ